MRNFLPARTALAGTRCHRIAGSATTPAQPRRHAPPPAIGPRVGQTDAQRALPLRCHPSRRRCQARILRRSDRPPAWSAATSSASNAFRHVSRVPGFDPQFMVALTDTAGNPVPVTATLVELPSATWQGTWSAAGRRAQPADQLAGAEGCAVAPDRTRCSSICRPSTAVAARARNYAVLPDHEGRGWRTPAGGDGSSRRVLDSARGMTRIAPEVESPTVMDSCWRRLIATVCGQPRNNTPAGLPLLPERSPAARPPTTRSCRHERQHRGGPVRGSHHRARTRVPRDGGIVRRLRLPPGHAGQDCPQPPLAAAGWPVSDLDVLAVIPEPFQVPDRAGRRRREQTRAPAPRCRCCSTARAQSCSATSSFQRRVTESRRALAHWQRHRRYRAVTGERHVIDRRGGARPAVDTQYPRGGTPSSDRRRIGCCCPVLFCGMAVFAAAVSALVGVRKRRLDIVGIGRWRSLTGLGSGGVARDVLLGITRRAPFAAGEPDGHHRRRSSRLLPSPIWR